jgi:hypothetical protein
MNLHDRLSKIGLLYKDINPLTGNLLFTDNEGNMIEILTDMTEVKD